MRSIKFRAWDGNKMYFGDDKFKYEDTTLGLSLSGEVLELNDIEYYPSIGFADGVILMQFTGLHDRTGREIFEGDVIKNKYGQLEKVIYELGGFAPFSIAGWEVTTDWKQCEIIGNLFENPNLIEEIQ